MVRRLTSVPRPRDCGRTRPTRAQRCAQQARKAPARFDQNHAGEVLILLALAACGSGDVDLEALSKPGAYGAGYRIMTMSYRPPLAAEDRMISVHVWYPAAKDAPGERPIYLLRKSELAITDAAPLELGPRPTIVYSHGSQAYAAVMSFMMEHLASHGYIAVAPTHTGNTFVDGADRQTEIYYQRPLDVRAVLDQLLALDAGDPLAGRFDAGRIALSGHSFGGYTAFALGGAQYRVDELDAECAAGTASPGYCSTMTAEKKEIFRAGFADPRFRALIDYDPGDFELFGAAGVAAIDRPVLHFSAEMSGEDEYAPALDGADDLRLRLVGGGHNDFTDSCASGFTLACSMLPPEQVWRPVRIYTLAFLEKMLRDATGYDVLLRGETSVSTLIAVTPR